MVKQMIEVASGLLKGASFESYFQGVQGKAAGAPTFEEARKDYEGTLHNGSGLRGF